MTAVLRAEWQSLTERPLAFVRDQALIECLERPVSGRQLAALRQTPRFAARMAQRLTGHFRLQPLSSLAVPDDADLTVLLLTHTQWARLPRFCGAVWHAATLSREIRGEVVKQYREALGSEALELALELRDLAGAADLLRTPAALVDSIDRDGAACVSAWLATQPGPLRGWLELRMEPWQAHAPGDAKQAQVVRQVAARLHALAASGGHSHEGPADE